MKRIILLLFINMLLVSCVNQNTGYRIVGKDGKVLYINRQRTEFNKEKLKEQQQKRENSAVNQNGNQNSQSINSKNTTTSNGSDKKIDENLALESSAYSLRSVVDTVVKNEDINDIAKIVEKTQDEKTIKDFDIPEYYFNSSKYNAKRISNSINQNSVNNLQTIDLANSRKSNKKSLIPIFSGDEEKKIRISKANVNQLNISQPITEDGKNIGNANQNLLKERYNNYDDLIILNSSLISNQQTKTSASDTSTSTNKKNSKSKAISTNSNKNTESSSNNLTTESSNSGRIRTLPTTISPVRSLSSNSSSSTSLSVKSSSTTSNKSSTKTSTKQNVRVLANDGLISKKYYIQIGSFKQRDKAEKLLNDFIFVGTDRKVVPVDINNTRMYRAVIGTFNSKEEATKETKKLLDRGHKDVFIFAKK